MDVAWIVVQTRAKKEALVASFLAQKGYEVFLPTTGNRGRGDEVVRPLFPSYVFCVYDRQRSARIVTTPGVRSLVKFGAHYALVTDEEMRSVRRIAESGLSVQSHSGLPRGRKVRVLRGPLAGAEGVVERSSKSCRVTVSLDLLQRSVSVALDVRQLAELEHESGPAFDGIEGTAAASSADFAHTGGRWL